MKKYLKFILGLTHKVEGSLPSLKDGAKNLLVIGAVDRVGLITGQFTKPLMWPIWIDNLHGDFLNPTSFLGEVL